MSMVNRKLLSILNKKREEITSQDIAYAKSLVKKYKSIKYSYNKAILLVNKGKNTIKNIKNRKTRDYLGIIADFVVNRKS